MAPSLTDQMAGLPLQPSRVLPSKIWVSPGGIGKVMPLSPTLMATPPSGVSTDAAPSGLLVEPAVPPAASATVSPLPPGPVVCPPLPPLPAAPALAPAPPAPKPPMAPAPPAPPPVPPGWGAVGGLSIGLLQATKTTGASIATQNPRMGATSEWAGESGVRFPRPRPAVKRGAAPNPAGVLR